MQKIKVKRLLGFLLAAAMLVSVFALFGCAEKEKEAAPVVEPPKYVIQPAALGENVEIHTEEQLEYLNDDPRNIADHSLTVANVERSQPKEVTLSWSVTGRETPPEETTYQILVSTSPTMENAKTYQTTGNSCSICNLYIGTTYYWRVSFAEDGKIYESETASFTTTSQGPRNLKVDGVTNCRDIGGWKTNDGRTVKQGMLFRTAKIDAVTEEGKKTMLEELGVKTEIDLRGSTSKSALDGVNVLNYTCESTATLLDLKPELPEIFLQLADEQNYPIFFHCQIGTDRTGGLAFLINALLGVAEEDLYRDYCFSNFGEICGKDETSYTVRDPMYLENKITFFMNRTAGKTLQEKVRNYLKSIGISDATLNAVARILLE